ncbi:MAG: type II secretion system protein GspM [Endozoicomonas sp.]
MISVGQLAAQKWQQLPPREQKLLLAAVPIALVLGVFLGLRGLINWQSDLQKQVENRQATLVEMQSLAKAIQGAGGSQPGKPDASIVRAGKRLALWDNRPAYESASRKASLDDRSFSAVLSWLATLEAQGIRTESIRLVRSDPGRVSGDVYFADNSQ